MLLRSLPVNGHLTSAMGPTERTPFVLLLLTLSFFLTATRPIPAQEQTSPPPPPISWLVVQVKDLTGVSPVGIERAITQALVEKLGAHVGWKAWANDPLAKSVRAAIEDGMITEEEAATVPDLASAQRLGLVWEADTVLIGLLVRRDDSIALLLNAVGTIGRQAAGPGKEVDIPSTEIEPTEDMSAAKMAEALTEGVAEKLAPLIEEHRGLWAKDAEFAPAWEADGDIYMLEGFPHEARMAYAAALIADPSLAACRRKLAQMLLELDRPEEARQQLEKALTLAPEDVEVLLALGETYLVLGNPEKAAEQFKAGVPLAEGDLRPKEGLARANLLQGDSAAALKAYEELLGEAPEDVFLHYWYGEALLETNRPDKAAEEFRLCLQLEPDYLDARHSLAELLIREGKLIEGIVQLRLVSDKVEEFLEYPLSDYQDLISALSEEFLVVLNEFDHRLYGYWDGEITQEEFVAVMQGLRGRSDNLARLTERILSPEELDESHRYWVLAANLLNHSDFEAYRYGRSDGSEYLRRAQLFRHAAREAAAEARSLAHIALEEETSEETSPLPPAQ
ncbi:MAG: tetratricopeptide repeat protein [Armatimonadetes bacterium]|nr:tetratricopeptide repeat protein [Armatimonadota bacterium]NIM23843.1 tetratricopeptide repeat protein [Armatimonadota bacterium]NIM67722.1 tetratricopeptide repeat protein [Armatimonadota bacterium]NIM76231.1 tetratricopeptide repeat protein [Armatimonadota bacterium]NIN05924.1 tetratricopeptide repeat protein [Armatimonadota bacterium]